MMHRNKSASSHAFAMIPRADIPRSRFKRQSTLKTAFNGSFLVPIFVDEVLPGDSMKLNATMFVRLATPIFPVMDNLHLDTFFFFVPNRLLWTNWKKFMGEQNNPGDSISFTMPTTTSPAGGYAVGSIFDYFGLPTVGQVGGGNTVTHTSMPLRAYQYIYNEWFRDENLQNGVNVSNGNGPDTYTDFALVRRGKRHDYFTSCLPWPQKGSTAVTLPLGSTAAVKSDGTTPLFRGGTGAMSGIKHNASGSNITADAPGSTFTSLNWGAAGASTTGLYADLSTATAATINQIRQAFQIQRLLERDARGGTRYTEIVFSHFGVRSPDARLQRPEYLGGGSTPITVNPIAQTSGTSASGTTTPLGNLAAMGTGLVQNNGFSQSFTEHGLIIGLASVRADITYQQGLRKLWSRSTRYDFYFPVFSHLGEQAVLNKELYCDGSANDDLVFGYQERWGEYRYFPSMITGLMRSTSASTIDPWHLAQKFTSLPTLNATFIQDGAYESIQRISAVGAGAAGQQLLCDAFFDVLSVRPMPMYSVPGMIDHF